MQQEQYANLKMPALRAFSFEEGQHLLRKNGCYFAFLVILGLTLAAYWPGLKGGFLFDDFPNLAPMGEQGGIRDWDTFRQFVFGGVAGPLGRPIPLASFLLDDNFWPSSPEPFKLTNLWLHLLTGLFLCWATLKLLTFYGCKENHARWGALLNMGLWLLHPYMVSTTLYVVQRMAQMTTLFMLAGLTGYLHGRLLIQKRKLAGYFWMSLSLAFGTLLAVFSKENGVLLPLLTLIIEWCRPGPAQKWPDWRWQIAFLWLPSAAVMFALFREINFSPDVWPTRPFNQVERLLTEPRILWEYLLHLFVPRIEGRGLFQDGYSISRNLSSPWTTLPSLLGIGVLLLAGVMLRKRLPYIALAIFFFLASHLVESTVVGLELYFEHRNYAAASFVFLPLVMGLLWISKYKSEFVATTTFFAIFGMLTMLTWQRAELWSDTDALQNYWASATPESARAQNHLAIQIFQHGSPEKGFEFLASASQRLPQSSLLSMQLLLQKVLHRRAVPEDFDHIRQTLPHQRFDAQTVLGMRMIVEALIEPDTPAAYRSEALLLLDVMQSLPKYQVVPLFRRLEPYLRGLLLASMGFFEEATKSLLQAMQLYSDVDASLSMVAHMGNAGRPHEGMQLLEKARELYSIQADRTLRRSRASYDMEMDRVSQLLQQDINTLDILQKGGTR